MTRGATLAAMASAALVAGCGRSAPPATPGGSLVLRDVVTGLGAVTDLAFLPGGGMVVTEKGGAVMLVDPGGAVTLAGSYLVDDASEKGLLGVAVDPDFASTRRLFLYLSAADAAGGTDLDRHRVVSVPLLASGTLDRSAERVLVRGLRGPANHDGGALAVGPDGKLYVGVGDSGCNSGQPPEPPRTPSNFLATCLTGGNGKILRVNLDGSVPDDNPLPAGTQVTACGAACADPIAPSSLGPARPDVWAWGFRNPWRFWFDPQTGELWVGDVGEITYEEVTLARRGRHHGWPWREGAHGWPPSACRQVVPDTGDCVDPVYECRHGPAAAGVDGDCQSITGGAIVDSARWPEADRGRYHFADNVTGTIWSVAVDATRTRVLPGSRREVARVQGGAPVSLRPGPDGDLYVAVLPGRVVRLGPAP